MSRSCNKKQHNMLAHNEDDFAFLDEICKENLENYEPIYCDDSIVRLKDWIGYVDDFKTFPHFHDLVPQLPPPVCAPITHSRCATFRQPDLFAGLQKVHPFFLATPPPYTDLPDYMAFCSDVMHFGDMFIHVQYLVRRWSRLSRNPLNEDMLRMIGQCTRAMIDKDKIGKEMFTMYDIVELATFLYCVLCMEK